MLKRKFTKLLSPFHTFSIHHRDVNFFICKNMSFQWVWVWGKTMKKRKKWEGDKGREQGKRERKIGIGKGNRARGGR